MITLTKSNKKLHVQLELQKRVLRLGSTGSAEQLGDWGGAPLVTQYWGGGRHKTLFLTISL